MLIKFVSNLWIIIVYFFYSIGLPLSLGLIKAEIIGTANWSFGMYPGLSIGCMNTLALHASEQQKKGE